MEQAVSHRRTAAERIGATPGVYTAGDEWAAGVNRGGGGTAR